MEHHYMHYQPNHMHHAHHAHHPHHPKTVIVHPVDPYVVEALHSCKGKWVVLETTRGRIEGCITDVKPDHVVLQSHHQNFLVRISEIVWIMPLHTHS